MVEVIVALVIGFIVGYLAFRKNNQQQINAYNAQLQTYMQNQQTNVPAPLSFQQRLMLQRQYFQNQYGMDNVMIPNAINMNNNSICPCQVCGSMSPTVPYNSFVGNVPNPMVQSDNPINTQQ